MEQVEHVRSQLLSDLGSRIKTREIAAGRGRLPSIFGSGGDDCRGGAGRGTANIAKPIFSRHFDDSVRIDNARGDAALHDEIAFDQLLTL